MTQLYQEYQKREQFKNKIAQQYGKFKISLLTMVGQDATPLSIIYSNIFFQFEKVLYNKDAGFGNKYQNQKYPINKNQLIAKRDERHFKKQENMFSHLSLLSKYQISQQNQQAVVIIQAQRMSHSMSKYDRIKRQNTKSKMDIQMKINQLTEQHNVQFVILQNILLQHKINRQKQNSKFQKLMDSKNRIGICKDCMQIRQIQKCSASKNKYFKSQIIQNKQETISQEEDLTQEPNNFKQKQSKKNKQQTFLSHQIQRNLQKLAYQISLKNKNQKLFYNDKIKCFFNSKFGQKLQMSEYQSSKNRHSTIKQDSFSQTQGANQSNEESKTIGQRQLILLIKQKELNRKIQEWKLEIQNMKLAYLQKQNELHQKQIKLQAFLNSRLSQVQIKSKQYEQFNFKRKKMSTITDLKNKLQLDSYRRNALINIQTHQIELLLEKQNISLLSNSKNSYSFLHNKSQLDKNKSYRKEQSIKEELIQQTANNNKDEDNQRKCIIFEA